MDDFKPHLYLVKTSGNNFKLSVIISVGEGYHLKKAPRPVVVPVAPGNPSAGKKHRIIFELVEDKLATSSIINTVVPLRRSNEIKAEVVVTIPTKPRPTGASAAHYADPDKKFKDR